MGKWMPGSTYHRCRYGSLESVIEQRKEAYYLALRQTQGTIRSESPDWQPWVRYFLKALQKTEDSSRDEDRARAGGSGRSAGTLDPNSRTRPRTWAGDNQRGRHSNWGKSKHDQGPRQDARGERSSDPTWGRPRHVVFVGLIRHTPGLFERSCPVACLSLAGRLLPGLGPLAGLPAKSDLLGKFAALFGIFRSHHRVILRQSPFYSILLR